MPARSKSQQRFMGMVRAAQKGEKPASKTVAKVAKKMDKDDVEDFASTKHKGLPNKMKKETKVRKLIRKMVGEVMKEDFGGAYPKEMRKKFDGKRRKQSEVLGYTLTGKDDIKTEIDDATVQEAKKRDYKAEYKKYGSSTKAKKYRAELNKYNRQKGTYGNGDKKDASHKGGKIVGFEEQSKNRGRREKSRLKKEGKLTETKFYAFFNRKKYTIDGKSLYDAKQKAITKLKVPKSKVGMLSIVNAKEHDRGGFRFEGKLNEKKETAIDVARRIVKNKQHEKGVDMQTANLIMKIYHAYDKNPALQKKLEKMPLKKLAHGVWKFVKWN